MNRKKDKPKITVKVKIKPKLKVSVPIKPKDKREGVKAAIRKYCASYPGQESSRYCILDSDYTRYPDTLLVYKRIEKITKLTNNRSMFMVFDHYLDEVFLVPIWISLDKEYSKEFRAAQEHGFKTLVITNPEEIARKLDSIQ